MYKTNLKDSKKCREFFKRSIFESNYDNIEKLQQRIIDSEEANEIWKCIRAFYGINS